MAAGGNVGFGDDPLGPWCYSQLLFADENSGFESDGFFGFTPSSFSSDDTKTPKMLRFGDYAKQHNENGKITGQEQSGLTCMDPSTKNINRKRNQNPGECGQKSSKKAKSENSRMGGHAKKGVKKVKLGERITAIQQLVSPFGKTDTASVLHEALGYIRFLHDQVQVLSTPYLHPHATEKVDLRSRGLCLVPVDLTLHVATSNGADLWSSTPT